MTDSDELFYPLMIALHVLYARPFKQNKRNLCLPDSLVPNEKRLIHQLVLNFRDRIFAHHDKNSRVMDETQNDLCQLVVHVDNNNEVSCGQQYVFPTGRQLNEIGEMCVLLERKCTDLMQKAWNQATGRRGVPPGAYTVSTSLEEDAPLLLKYKAP